MIRTLTAFLIALCLMTLPVRAENSQHEAPSHPVSTSSSQAVHSEAGGGAASHGDIAVPADSMHSAMVGDSVLAGEGHGEHADEANPIVGILAHHLTDSPNYDLPWGTYHLPKLNLYLPALGITDGLQITKHMVGLVVAALLVIVLVIPGMGRTRRGDIPHGFGNFLEILVIFIRDEVVYPNMGAETGRKWLPVFLTFFFLILFSNLLGMIPWGTAATGNVNMTAGLAISVLLLVFIGGFAKHGVKYFGTFIPHGVPVWVVFLLFPIEIFGLFVKHFALCIRLFANMLAGHTVIGVFLALILSPFIALASVPGAVAISMLELFVAFLQAYIFVMLGSIFVGSAIHPAH